MDTSTPPVRGTNIRAYKADAAPARTQPERVEIWRGRIARAVRDLHIDQRREVAERVGNYINGTPTPYHTSQKLLEASWANGISYGQSRVWATGRKGYHNHIFLGRLEPALRDLHKQTLPGVPTPTVKARNKFGVAHEERARQLLETQFEQNGDEIDTLADDVQWFDDKWGAFIAKVEWETVERDASPSQPQAEEVIILQGIHAEEENSDPQNAEIGEDDVDTIHVSMHADGLMQFEYGSDEHIALDMHMMLHEARLTTIVSERVSVKALPTDQYIHDPDRSWVKRKWEAELEMASVSDLAARGFRNLTLENLPLLLDPDGYGPVPFEDMMVAVWHIHDIANKMSYAISAKPGNSDSLFLEETEWPFDDIEIYRLDKFREFDPNCPYGLATGKQALPLLDEIANVEWHIQRHVARHSNYKTLVPKGANTKQFKADMQNDDKEYADVTPEVAMGVKEHRPPPIPDALLQRRDQLVDDLRRIIGIDAQDMGDDHGHVITATESARRGSATDSTRNDRQKIVAALLSWYAQQSLKMRRKFSTMVSAVKVRTPGGVGYEYVDARELPDAFDMLVDVQSETDQAKSLEMNKAIAVRDHLRSSLSPVNHLALDAWFLRKMSVQDIEQFFGEGPQGPENVEGSSQQQGGALPFERDSTQSQPKPQSQPQPKPQAVGA